MTTYFKYKSIQVNGDGSLSESSLKEVINPIEESYYYLPNRNQLNDPTEGAYDNQVHLQLSEFLTSVYALSETQDLSRAIIDFLNFLSHANDNTGVFSLSKVPADELMWAHYANSHHGIVIEYDFSGLIRFSSKQHLHHFDVAYSNTPPELRLEVIQADPKLVIRSMLGNKSTNWRHEEEFRILLENISGKVPHDYRAIKSITFGLRIGDKAKQQIYERTKHKVPAYYQITKQDNSYTLARELLSELSGSVPTGTAEAVNWEGHFDLPPVCHTNVKFVKSVNFMENDGYETNTIHRRTDHRLSEASRSRDADQGTLPPRWIQ